MKKMPPLNNSAVAQLLREVAAAYEILGKNFFEIRAYQQAAEAIEHASVSVYDLWQQGNLQKIPGVGGNIAQHLDQLFRQGYSDHFEEIKAQMPPGMFVLLPLPGIGPKTAFRLAQELKIRSFSDLEKACREHRIAALPGFGLKSESKILQSLHDFSPAQNKRLLLPQADYIAGKFKKYLQQFPFVERVEALGSLRRMAATIGDIDLAVQSPEAEKTITAFINFPAEKQIINQGEVKAALRLGEGVRVDLRVERRERFGSLLQYFTGSKSHNIHLRELALKKGLSLSEYGIREKNGTLHLFAREEDFYAFLGLPWIPPELREDNGEIEAALAQQLPQLVQLQDIRGDLHVHCNFDLEESHDRGQASIEEIAKAAQKKGYHYIAVGNHSPSLSGHDEKDKRRLLEAKRRAIDKVQQNFPRLKLLHMVEVDILANGELALSNNNLKLLDLAIAGVHSSLQQDRKQMTQRILRALRNPYIHGLAHPSGRLLNKRPPYEVDWEKVFRLCREEGKFLEINAFYTRLDLPDLLIREAIRAGVKLAINTDAHQLEQLDLMVYGVAMARRGWAEVKDIVNCAEKWPAL